MSLGRILGVRFLSVGLAVVGCLLFDALVTANIKEFYVRLIVLSGLYVTLAVSLNLINGITGQFSIGHAAFYMVGAYAGATVSNMFFQQSPLAAPAWLIVSLISGAIFAALAGLLVGLPSLRLKGDYLAIVTLGFGEIVRIIAQNQEAFGKSYGFNVVPKHQAIWLVWLLAIVCIAVCRNLLKSIHGLGFLAVREDEIAAQAMGVNLTKHKVVAFVIGAAFAGAAGALLAHTEGFVTPDQFKMEVSFLILTMVVLGGSGSITGSALAGATLFIIPEMGRIVKFDVSLAMLICILGGIGFMVWLNRRFASHIHTTAQLKGGPLSGLAMIGAIGCGYLFGKILDTFTLLGSKAIRYDFESNALRAVLGTGTTWAMVVGLVMGVGLAVCLTGRLRATTTTNSAGRNLFIGLANVGVFAVVIVLGHLLEVFTVLGDKHYEANNVRYMILAVVLLVVMLLRPVGLLAHHEFSWRWLKETWSRFKNRHREVPA